MCALFFGKTEIKPSPASPDFRYLYIFLLSGFYWLGVPHGEKERKAKLPILILSICMNLRAFVVPLCCFFFGCEKRERKKQGKSRARFSRWVGYLVSLCFALTLNMYKFQMWITHAFTHSTVSHSLTHSRLSLSPIWCIIIMDLLYIFDLACVAGFSFFWLYIHSLSSFFV